MEKAFSKKNISGDLDEKSEQAPRNWFAGNVIFHAIANYER